MRVSEIGEDALITRIAARLDRPPAGEVWTGDDAAVIASPARRLLLTTDLLVEGVDFDLSWCRGADIGWKAIAVNASDIAAMGGRPHVAVASLSLRGDIGVGTVDDIVDGLGAASRRWAIALVGGDISGAREVMLSVAATGVLASAPPVLRSGARDGEAICVTGTLGAAAAGLAVLRARDRPEDGFAGLVERQLRPRARVEEGVALARCGATAMIDVSDGLAVDLGRILDASGTGCEVDPGAVPVDAGVGSLARARPDLVPDALEAAMLGGEDFELLFTIDEADLPAAREALLALATEVTRIGTVVAGRASVGDEDLERWRERGWQHLHGR
jgi:thiamine-monophosphate kinase